MHTIDWTLGYVTVLHFVGRHETPGLCIGVRIPAVIVAWTDKRKNITWQLKKKKKILGN